MYCTYTDIQMLNRQHSSGLSPKDLIRCEDLIPSQALTRIKHQMGALLQRACLKENIAELVGSGHIAII